MVWSSVVPVWPTSQVNPVGEAAAAASALPKRDTAPVEEARAANPLNFKNVRREIGVPGIDALQRTSEYDLRTWRRSVAFHGHRRLERSGTPFFTWTMR